MSFEERVMQRLVAGLGARAFPQEDGSIVLALTELGTALTVHAAPQDGGPPPSMQVRTTLGTVGDPDAPGVLAFCGAANASGGLSRWLCEPESGLLSMSASLVLVEGREEQLLRLADFLVRSQASEVRAKLFAGACDLAKATPALLTDRTGEYLWDGEDFRFAAYVEEQVLPSSEENLWQALRPRGVRVLPVPVYDAYQGPGWLGTATGWGWRVQLPWTSVARDYGAITIRPDRLLDYTQGETLDLDVDYGGSSAMWGAGLRLSTVVPHPAGETAENVAAWLNVNDAVLTWTHGLGRFLDVGGRLVLDLFAPGVLARDRAFAGWLEYELLRCAAITVQEVRPQLFGGDPVPHEELSASVAAESVP